MLAASEHERLAVDEDPDRAVGAEEEPDAAQPPGRFGHQRAVVDELRRWGPRIGGGCEPVEAVPLELRAGVAPAVDDENGALAVEEHRRPLRVAQIGGIGETAAAVTRRARR